MHVETSIEIDAPQQRVWDVVSDLESWPRVTETVTGIELLTPRPIGPGARVRLIQPKLPVGTWEITSWEAPTYFEWIRRTGGVTSVAGHRIAALGMGRCRLTLTLDTRGLMSPLIGLFSRGLVDRYLRLEAEGMKRAAETAETAPAVPV